MNAEIIRVLKEYVQILDKLDELKGEKKVFSNKKKECQEILKTVCEEEDTDLQTRDVIYMVEEKKKYLTPFKKEYVQDKIMNRLPGAAEEKKRILDFILEEQEGDVQEEDIIKIKKLK